MKRTLPFLTLAALVLAAGSASAASPVRTGGTAALNPQPIPPGFAANTLGRKPPVCLSCPQSGFRLPGSDRMLNPQPLPPKILGIGR